VSLSPFPAAARNRRAEDCPLCREVVRRTARADRHCPAPEPIGFGSRAGSGLNACSREDRAREVVSAHFARPAPQPRAAACAVTGERRSRRRLKPGRSGALCVPHFGFRLRRRALGATPVLLPGEPAGGSHARAATTPGAGGDAGVLLGVGQGSAILPGSGGHAGPPIQLAGVPRVAGFGPAATRLLPAAHSRVGRDAFHCVPICLSANRSGTQWNASLPALPRSRKCALVALSISSKAYPNGTGTRLKSPSDSCLQR
jgi:hypothetical protein